MEIGSLYLHGGIPVTHQLTGPTQINSPRMYLVDSEESAKVALKILERENLEVWVGALQGRKEWTLNF